VWENNFVIKEIAPFLVRLDVRTQRRRDHGAWSGLVIKILVKRVLFFLQKKTKKKKVLPSQSQKVVKKKANGVLRHPVVSFKRVARMPTKERNVVLKELKHQQRKRSGRVNIKGGTIPVGEGSNCSNNS
jgi:hypothetical protein